MAYGTILYEKSKRIARITLNRPEKLNALSVQLRHEIVAAIHNAEQDGEINVVILKGAGRELPLYIGQLLTFGCCVSIIKLKCLFG